MTFKENLLKKIKINRLSNKVLRSIKKSESPLKIDKESMTTLLKMLPYNHQNDRFMDLYIKESDNDKLEILVLDNELPLYKTTLQDVLMRKNPTLKEMISIKNAIKILNDSDVVISKNRETIDTIRKECMTTLNLNYGENDIESIKNEGIAALENWEAELVIECIDMFSELLGYQKIPTFLKIENILFNGIRGEKNRKETFGPILIYDITHNAIKFFNESFERQNTEMIDLIKNIAIGKENGTIEGGDVFGHLNELVLKTMQPIKLH